MQNIASRIIWRTPISTFFHSRWTLRLLLTIPTNVLHFGGINTLFWESNEKNYMSFRTTAHLSIRDVCWLWTQSECQIDCIRGSAIDLRENSRMWFFNESTKNDGCVKILQKKHGKISKRVGKSSLCQSCRKSVESNWEVEARVLFLKVK